MSDRIVAKKVLVISLDRRGGLGGIIPPSNLNLKNFLS